MLMQIKSTHLKNFRIKFNNVDKQRPAIRFNLAIGLLVEI